MKERIGIYPGTFDPIHQGHVSFALEASRLCDLDQIVFLPEPSPRNKHSVTNIADRISYIKKVVKNIPKLLVFSPSSTQFTVRDTLPELRAQFKDAELTLLVGSDVMKTFQHRWEDLDFLLKNVSLAIGMRTGDNNDDIIAIVKQLEQQYNIPIRYTLVTTSDSHRASSHLRNSSVLSSDILQRQFGTTQLVIVEQNTRYRIIKTIASADNSVLELSLVTFNQSNVDAFPNVHQAILMGESIGLAYQKAGILFKRDVTAINHVTLLAELASYFEKKGQATVVEVNIYVDSQQIHYCSILEIYSPSVQWPEPATTTSSTIPSRLQEFSDILGLRAQDS